MTHQGRNGSCDPWWENKTEWHRKWQAEFPDAWQEIVHHAETGKHIADVKTDRGWFIEFQHSYLKPEERRSRDAFYRRVIWVVDGTRRKRDAAQLLSAWDEGIPIGGNPFLRRAFSDNCTLLREWGGSNTPIFFDLGEAERLWWLLANQHPFARLGTKPSFRQRHPPICELAVQIARRLAVLVDPLDSRNAPVMGREGDDNTAFEQSEGHRSGYVGVRVESEFWRDEWIEHQSQSVRVRGDADQTLPQFIVETDGTRMASADLNNEDIGRWLWFRSSVVNELLSHRGFSLQWFTAQTGGIRSTSGCVTHFGIDSSDLVTVYAYDVARLATWEQHIWAAHNVVPDGKVSNELLAAQVKAQPASTHAVEDLLFKSMRMLEAGFRRAFNVSLYTHDIDDAAVMQHVSRFASKDQASLLRLAKELVRVFSDRLNVRELRKLATHPDKEKLGSNKLLQDVLAQKVGADRARLVFGAIAGTYEMRVADAHPTGSNIGDALRLAGIDESRSFLSQGEQLISNFGHAVWWIGKLLFEQPEKQGS